MSESLESKSVIGLDSEWTSRTGFFYCPYIPEGIGISKDDHECASADEVYPAYPDYDGDEY